MATPFTGHYSKSIKMIYVRELIEKSCCNFCKGLKILKKLRGIRQSNANAGKLCQLFQLFKVSTNKYSPHSAQMKRKTWSHHCLRILHVMVCKLEGPFCQTIPFCSSHKAFYVHYKSGKKGSCHLAQSVTREREWDCVVLCWVSFEYTASEIMLNWTLHNRTAMTSQRHAWQDTFSDDFVQMTKHITATKYDRVTMNMWMSQLEPSVYVFDIKQVDPDKCSANDQSRVSTIAPDTRLAKNATFDSLCIFSMWS